MARRSDKTKKMSGWGLQLFLYRDQRRWSRRYFADRVNAVAAELKVNVSLGERLVARWEQGDVRNPGPVYQQLLTMMGAPVPGDMYGSAMVSALPLPLAHSASLPTVESEAEVDEVERRNFLGAIGAAVVGSVAGLAPWFPARTWAADSVSSAAKFTEITYLREVTDSLRVLDQKHGGRAVLAAAESLFQAFQGLELEGDEAAVAAALGDLSALIGWAYHDAGDQRRARQYLAQGLAYARPVGAHSLAASIMYRLGRVNLLERRPLDALRMFQLGQIPATDAHSLPDKARLWTNEAWAWAMLGDERQMCDALSRAEHELELANDADTLPWNRAFFAVGDFHGHRGVISNEFALAVDDSRVAERYTTIAAEAAYTTIETADSDRSPRSSLFDHIVLASASLRLGEAGVGTEAAWKAIELARPIRSARANDRFRGLVSAAEPMLARSDIRDVRHEIDRQQLALPARVG